MSFSSLRALRVRFDSQKNIIYIDPKYPMSRKTNTLAHEILHATFEYSGLGHLFSEGQEEAIVRCIEYNFFKYLDHNKLKTILAEAELVSDDITKPKK